MLSGETAVGKYPIETVALMKRIIDQAESHFNYRDYFFSQVGSHFYDVASAVSAAVVKTSYSAEAMGIIVCTARGSTAKSISRFRPGHPILAVTPIEKTYHQMALNWGVIPILQEVKSVAEAIHYASCFAMEKKILSYGDLVVVSSGSPFNVPGSTNMMMVDIIGDVLVRGLGHGSYAKVQAQVVVLLSPDQKAYYAAKNKLLLLSTCDEAYRQAIKHSKGVILQNLSDDHKSEEAAIHLCAEYKIPLITRADNAFAILQENQFITLDVSKGAIFKGSISSDEEMYSKMCQI
jgi:pyruvate kinase